MPTKSRETSQAIDFIKSTTRAQELQREALAVEPVGRPLQAAIQEAAVAPQVGAGKQKELRAVVAGPGRSGGHANTTNTEGPRAP